MKRVPESKLRYDYKYISKGDKFPSNVECKLVEKCGDGTAWFLGSRGSGTENKVRCNFVDFNIFDSFGTAIIPIDDF